MKKILSLAFSLVTLSLVAANETEIHREEFVAHINGKTNLSCQDSLEDGSDAVKLTLDTRNTDIPDDIEHYDYYTFIDYGYEPPITCNSLTTVLNDENIVIDGLHITYQHNDGNGETREFDKVRLKLQGYPLIRFFNK